jgi:hypothetical protein
MQTILLGRAMQRRRRAFQTKTAQVAEKEGAAVADLRRQLAAKELEVAELKRRRRTTSTSSSGGFLTRLRISGKLWPLPGSSELPWASGRCGKFFSPRAANTSGHSGLARCRSTRLCRRRLSCPPGGLSRTSGAREAMSLLPGSSPPIWPRF